jgi:hypothetical protein
MFWLAFVFPLVILEPIPVFWIITQQNKLKKLALGAIAFVVVAGITFAASGKLPVPVLVLRLQLRRTWTPSSELSPNSLRPRPLPSHRLPPRLLANSRLDGFAVCTQKDEATAAQYVEVAAMIDKAKKHAAEFMKIVDGVMDSEAGMSDCDY